MKACLIFAKKIFSSLFLFFVFFFYQNLFAQDTISNGSNLTMFQKLNETLGIELWQDDFLWDDLALETASRLKWPEESRNRTQSSYRQYPSAQTRILGARPYSLALYGQSGYVQELSLVFVNKGDYAGPIPSPSLESREKARSRDFQKHMERMATAFESVFEQDTQSIETNLTVLLGVPKRDQFGQGKETRERVLRWDWNGHAVLLAATPGEYVGLRILPLTTADADGRGIKIGDNELRQLLRQRVVRRENGDIIVTDIPMVNQGPKGFCVPATWERYLRYLGISADMYLLAMAGNTSMGGGTYTFAMANSAKELVRRNGRRLDTAKTSLKTRNLARYIENGLPLMWSMLVNQKLDLEITRRTFIRKTVQDWSQWNQSLKTVREAAKDIKVNLQNGHVCMIIGYNDKTGEIATSDSWGPEYTERWWTVEEAEAVSQGELQLISW